MFQRNALKRDWVFFGKMNTELSVEVVWSNWKYFTYLKKMEKLVIKMNQMRDAFKEKIKKLKQEF